MSVRTTAPPVAAAADWRFPAVTESWLDNGLRVLAYDCPGQYVVAASLLFDVRLTAEPRSHEGVAGLTGRCLTRGAADRTAEEFADAVALCGADLDASAFPDGFAVRLAAPTTTLSAAMGLMADAVRCPTFAADEFAQEKRLRTEEIQQALAYPQHVASEQLNAALFGTARAARPVGGTTETVQQVERDDVVAYASTNLHPANTTLVVAGDFAGLDLLTAVRDSFAGWTQADVPAGNDERPTVGDAAQLLLVDWPDAPQSTIRIGGTGIMRSDPRWPSLFVANFAVGGNFSSRVNTVLREEKGVTYGANSALDTGRGTGLVTVSTDVRTDATAESVADIVSILEDARRTLTDDEVQTGVRASTSSAAVGFERSEAVVARVEVLLSQGLPLDHVDTNLAALRAVSTSSANQAYVDIVRPDRLGIVVVGDAATIREPLSALGYADVKEVEPVG